MPARATGGVAVIVYLLLRARGWRVMASNVARCMHIQSKEKTMRLALLVVALGLALVAVGRAQDGSKKSLEELFKAARAAQNAGKKDDAVKLADQAVKDYPKEA